MSTPFFVACLWVLASSGVAMLPMKRQYIPGLALMISAPLLILWIAISVSPWIALAALAAFVSMYRNPLRYFWSRLRGEQPDLPQ